MARGVPRSAWGAGIVVACVLALACSGCRSCADERGAAADAGPAQPTMPIGMLMPAASAGARAAAGGEPGAEPGAGLGGLRIARGLEGGAWTELQVARPGDTATRREFQHWRDDSWFVSLEAMTLLHEPFARALPGFDLFLPRLFTPDALTRLAVELEAFARDRGTADDLTATARELAQIATAGAAKQQSLWVLGP